MDVFTGPDPTPSSLAWLAGVRHGGNVTFASWPLLTYYVRVEGVDNHTGPIRVRADFTEAVHESASPSPSPIPSPLPVAAVRTGLMDRLPAMISVTSTVLAGLLVVVNMALQVRLGVTESVVGIPGVGLDYGGVGGGVLGIDVGLLQVRAWFHGWFSRSLRCGVACGRGVAYLWMVLDALAFWAYHLRCAMCCAACGVVICLRCAVFPGTAR